MFACLMMMGASLATADGGGDPGPDNPMTAEGDMIVGGVDGEMEALPIGDEGDWLQVVDGAPAWAVPS